MSRHEYDVAEPGTPPDAVTDPPPGGPICPHCGGGPLVATGLGLTCKSCARVVMPRRAPVAAPDDNDEAGS